MTLPSQFRGHRFHSLSGNQVPHATTKTWSSQIKKEIFYTSHAVFGTFNGFLTLTWASLVAQLVKESTCNAGDLSSVSGLGRSPGGGKGYPLQYSSASLVVQLVKNPPTMQEAWVPSLVWEDPLEKGKATHSNILTWRIPWTIQSMVWQRTGYD